MNKIISNIITFFVVIIAGEMVLSQIKKEHPEYDWRNPILKTFFPRKDMIKKSLGGGTK
jgi:hypothetical protein